MKHKDSWKKGKWAVMFLSLVLSLTVLTLPSFGFGDSIDHDNDFTIGDGGGSVGDWDYGSDGGSTFLFFGDGGGGGAAVGVVIFVIIVVIVIWQSKKKGAGTEASARGPLRMTDSYKVDLASLAKLREKDPQFSEAAMLSKVENWFVTIQMAWSDMDYEPVRPLLSNALYEQHAKQLEAKKERNERNLSSEMAVLESKLESYYSDGHAEYLQVWLRVKLKDYVVQYDDPTKILRGSPQKTYYLDYRWQLTRSAGGQTDAETDAARTGECPNCGANINMNQSGKCAYCGSVISTTEYDWVLSKVDRLQQISR